MSDEKKIAFEDMYLAPASHTRGRVEAAMPGTSEIPSILELEPPPIDPELVSYSFADDERDSGPDPVAEFSLTTNAKGVFAPAAIGGALTPELRRDFATPTFYVRTPAGRMTFMQSSDAPSQGVAVTAGWRLGEESDVDRVAAGAEKLGKWLTSRLEGFLPWEVSRAEIAVLHARARSILSVAPEHVEILIWPKRKDDRFDGRKVWRTLHAVGLKWGDGDQFHWDDSTNQTDYLFSAEVDDGEFGYALPERISADEQHFEVIRFGFTVPRTPFPLHVLEQMTLAAQATALELDGLIAPCVDGVVVSGTEELTSAVQRVVDELASLGVKPGSSSVCILR